MFLATPWWVNLLALVPVAAYISWRNGKLSLDKTTLASALAFGLAFGFVEASVVVYLRAAIGLLPGVGVFVAMFTPSASMRLGGGPFNKLATPPRPLS